MEDKEATQPLARLLGELLLVGSDDNLHRLNDIALINRQVLAQGVEDDSLGLLSVARSTAALKEARDEKQGAATTTSSAMPPHSTGAADKRQHHGCDPRFGGRRGDRGGHKNECGKAPEEAVQTEVKRPHPSDHSLQRADHRFTVVEGEA